MNRETLILKVKLPNLFRASFINYLCSVGYEKTGNKFSLEFHGSKGYLSHLEISCEGFQRESNRISDLFNKDGTVKKKMLNIFYSKRNGVRLSLGKDHPRVVEPLSLKSFGDAACDYGLSF
jgi:hypothetical protein